MTTTPAIDLLDLIGRDTTLKKVSGTRGGEYAGACPFCGGTDRLRVQPEQGQWWCRQCSPTEHWNSAADYVMQRDTVSFVEAKQILGLADDQQRTTAPEQADPHTYAQAHGCTWADFEAWGCEWGMFRYIPDRKGKDYPGIWFPEPEDSTATGRIRFFGAPSKWAPSAKGMTPVLWGLPKAMALALTTGQPLVLVNGQSSVIAMQARGIAAFAIPGGEGGIAGRLCNNLAAQLKGVWSRDVIVLLDGDGEGYRAAPKVVTELHAAGILATAKDPGDGHDGADFVRLYNGSAVAALRSLPELASAVPSERSGNAPPAGSSSPSKLLHAGSLNTIPLTQWLIDNMLATNKLSQLFAPPGTGKSFVALDMALCVAQVAPVVYVAAEAVEDYQDRVTAWCEHHKLEAGQLYFWPEPVQLGDANAITAFVTELAALQPALIVVDPLASCMVGLEESSTGDMIRAVDALNRIRTSTRAAVYIVHHTGWADTHERGSSVLRAACRVVLKLSTDDSGLMALTCEKTNNGKPFDARYFRLVEAGPSAVPIPTDKTTLRNAPLAANQLKVLEALDLAHFRSGASHTQLFDATNIGKSTIHYALNVLMTRGYVEADGKRSKLYKLTEKGRQEVDDRLNESMFNASSEVQSTTELGLNWSVNKDRTSRPNAKFSEFNPESQKTPLVQSSTEQTVQSSSEATPRQNAVVQSSSVRVQSEFSGQVQSSVPVCSLEHGHTEQVELNNDEPNGPTLAPGVEQPRITPDRIAVDPSRIQELVDGGMTRAEAQHQAVIEARASSAPAPSDSSLFSAVGLADRLRAKQSDCKALHERLEELGGDTRATWTVEELRAEVARLEAATAQALAAGDSSS